MSFVFGTASKASFKRLHPVLQLVTQNALNRNVIDFKILDSTRGKAAQERAFRQGHSKVHFGQSAHNWNPAIAEDLFPAPYDWDDEKAFESLYHLMMEEAKKIRLAATYGSYRTPIELINKPLQLRCGLDWNMNGLQPKDKDNWDGGHYELHPWREWAKTVKPFQD